MRILVGILHCGENEYARCLAALASQRHETHERFIIEDRPNKEAHDLLYATFMRRAGEFDAFVKLDADMVLADEHALGRIAALLDREREIDHLIFPLWDWASKSVIYGLHAFSSRARWTPTDEGLFVDPDPEVPGRRIRLASHALIATHAPSPGPYQAFHFGTQRALKAAQRDRRGVDPTQVREQWRFLTRLWKAFVAAGDRRRGLALAGADAAFRGEIAALGAEYRDAAVVEVFERYRDYDSGDLHRMLAPRWGGRRARARMLLEAVGARWLAAELKHGPRKLLRFARNVREQRRAARHST